MNKGLGMKWMAAAVLLVVAVGTVVFAQSAPASGVAATTAALNQPHGLAYDTAGNFYIADTDVNVIRKVDRYGVITTVAGDGEQGYGGDGGLATAALLDSPAGVAVDASGNIYIADTHNNRVREVLASSGNIMTIAGAGVAGYSGDGHLATLALLNLPTAVAFDSQGNVYVADTNNHRIREITGGNITTVAGDGEQFYSGDGGQATAAGLDSPSGVAVDAAFNIYIGDTHNQLVRMVTFTTGVITTLAGTGVKGFTADGPAASAALARPRGVAVDTYGDVYLADSDNNRIRAVSGGSVTTIAGNGGEGFSGDGSSAISAWLDTPGAVAISGATVLFSDTENNRVRQVSSGMIDTLAGMASPPVQASLISPAAGSALGSSAAFTWTPGTGVIALQFWLGSTGAGSSDLYNSGYTSATTANVTGLPTIGGTIYARLWSEIYGSWNYTDYTFTEATVPAIVWAAPAAIPYPTPLSSTQLDASSAVAGTFAYSPLSGTVLTPGTYTLSVVFTPSDTLDYTTATATTSLTVTKGTQSINFPAITATVYAATTFDLTASASSGLAVSYTSFSPTICTVSGSTVSLLTSGTCLIEALQAGNSAYSAALPVYHGFWVGHVSQSITFPAITATVYAATTFDLTASASSGLAVSYTSLSPTICTVSGSTASLLASGTCLIEASQPGNSAYSAASPAYHGFWVSHVSQTITFPAITATVYAATTLNLTATATSGLTVSFTSSTPNVCTVTGGVASLIASGTCSLEATQPGNAAYSAASPVYHSFWVSHVPQTITFPAITATEYAATTLGLTATASSGLTVSFTSSTPDVCTVTGGVASLIASGTCSLEATQAGDSSYVAASPVYHSFWVSHVSQTINFPAIASQVAGTSVGLTATASSGLTVSFTSTTPTVCTVSGSTASLLASGACTIQASQAGNTIYSAATNVKQSFAVTAQ